MSLGMFLHSIFCVILFPARVAISYLMASPTVLHIDVSESVVAPFKAGP